MLDDDIRDKARQKLTVGPRIPDDAELDARYLGRYDSHAQLVRMLFTMDAPHIDLGVWPYCHIDWDRAASALALDGPVNLLEIDGHWFDALAAAPVLPA